MTPLWILKVHLRFVFVSIFIHCFYVFVGYLQYNCPWPRAFDNMTWQHNNVRHVYLFCLSCPTGMSEMEHAQAAVDLTVQPEDQDADLEHTLNSHHSTLLEMVDQIGKACRRQYISEAANSVLRRYRRQRLKKSLARKTTTPNPQSRGESQHRSVHHPTAFPSPVRRHPDRAETSPGREVDRARRGQQRPLLAMDFNSSEPSQAVAAMNQTFTVSRGSPHRSLPPGSPLRQTYSPVVRSPAQTLSINRGQGPLFPKTCPNSPARPWFNTKWRSQEGCGGSQDAFARHSNSDSLEAKRARYNPASPSALRKQPPLSPRRMVQQHCPSPSQLRIYSPRSSSATGSLRFQRRHSFDSAPRPSVTCSAARLEEEFTKHYHKFVCQGTSSLANGVPCPCSARRLESSRGSYMSSTSVLSALALSPQRSVLWKRHRELDQDGSPGSKRPRVLTSSPGSLRHHKESRRSPSAPFNGRYLKYIF